MFNMLVMHSDSIVCMERLFCVCTYSLWLLVLSDVILNHLSLVSSQIIEECNTQVGKMKQMEELIQINGMLEFDKLKVSK